VAFGYAKKSTLLAANPLAKTFNGRTACLGFKTLSTKTFAVDAPDGEHDLSDLEEHAAGVEDIIQYAALHEKRDKIIEDHAAGLSSAFAVDAPDGDHDLQDLEEHALGVETIIDFCAKVENADKINADHAAGSSDGFYAVDAPDGEHDLEDLEEHAEGVGKIIDEASKLENPDKVIEHQRLQTATQNVVERYPSAP